MFSKSRALKLAKDLLPMSVLLIIALGLAVGLALVQAGDEDRVAEIGMFPDSSPDRPVVMAAGGTQDFEVAVFPHGRDVTVVSISMEFDPTLLEVVDADGDDTNGTQIEPHPGNPLRAFEIENQVDNAAGTIRYTVGDTVPVSFDFPLAIITFRAKDGTTAPGEPTMVDFRVDNSRETSVAFSGIQLLRESEDFPGAWIEIEDRVVELLMLPATSVEAPAVISDDGEQAFTVQVRPHGREVTGVSLVISFDPSFLRVVDADPGRPGVQIESHLDNPLAQFTIENEVDNEIGEILFTVGDSEPASGRFDLAIITLRAQSSTPEGDPTPMKFLVEDGNLTSVSTSGRLLLANTEDFVGAWIETVVLAPAANAVIIAPNQADEGQEVTFDGRDRSLIDHAVEELLATLSPDQIVPGD